MGFFATALVPASLPADAAAQNAIATDPDVIPFAPPLDQPLLLTWTLRRDVTGGAVIKTSVQQLNFTRVARGYRLRMRLRDVSTTGPAAMADMLALGDRALRGQELEYHLAADGRIIDSQDVNRNLVKMLAAIDLLKDEIAENEADPAVRAQKLGFLSRLQAMDQTAQTQYLESLVAPVLVLAGRPLRNLSVEGADMALTKSDVAAWHFAATSRRSLPVSPSQSAEVIEVSEYCIERLTGLTTAFHRRIETRVGGDAKTASDRFELRAENATEGRDAGSHRKDW